MTELLPWDINEILHTELGKERRANDFLLHASSHLTGSLRHAQLEVAGAPTIGEELVRGMPLWIGSLIHEDIHRILRKVGVPYMAEVNLNPWLPAGWGGTADAVVWNPELKAFVLVDIKTSKGENMRYIRKDGAKDEHRAQTSAYWHALKKMGIPLAKAIGVYYLPKNDTRSKDELVEPLLIDFDPIPARQLHGEMKRRHQRVNEYRESLGEGRPTRLTDWVTDALEPVQPRQQRVYYNKTQDVWELKLVPHWSAGFCPFDAQLCDCGQQGTTKIGIFDYDGQYYPRTGFEDIEPVVDPPVG